MKTIKEMNQYETYWFYYFNPEFESTNNLGKFQSED